LRGPSDPHDQGDESMKRTLTAFTAAIFAAAVAIPAFAQMGDSNPPSSSVNTSSTSESSRTDSKAEQPAPTTNSVERTEKEYRSERTDQSGPAGTPEEQHTRVEHKETSRTTSEALPPPVDSSTTTTTTHRTESGY